MASVPSPARLRELSAAQRRALQRMEVDVYRLRPQSPAPGIAVLPEDDPLARALARAAGKSSVAEWCAAWLAAGQSLPDLAELRARPAAKRALWLRMRGRLR